MQLKKVIKLNNKYNIYFINMLKFQEIIKNKYVEEVIWGKKLEKEDIKRFEVSCIFNDTFKYKYFKKLKNVESEEIEMYYMIHYLKKDEKELKEKGINLRKCIKVEAETFKEINKNTNIVEIVFYYYNKYYASKEGEKGEIKCKNNYFCLLKLKIWHKFYLTMFKGDGKLKYIYYKKLKKDKSQKNDLYQDTKKINYQLINRKWFKKIKIKNFNYLNYDVIKKDKNNVYYMSVNKFNLYIQKIYYKEFRLKKQCFKQVWLNLSGAFKYWIMNQLDTFFIYTCILKSKKVYKRHIKYKIEYILHINENDVEYLYENWCYKEYYKNINIYKELENCDIIKKGETLENLYLKYLYKNDKKNEFEIKESHNKKKVKSKFVLKMKPFKVKNKNMLIL